MSQIIINGPGQAIKAGNWADKNIKGNWRLDIAYSNPFSNKYHFVFSNPGDATLFALKWFKG
jgi:hypothetical protein